MRILKDREKPLNYYNINHFISKATKEDERMSCHHDFKSNDWKARCVYCDLPFCHIKEPDKWDKDGRFIPKKRRMKG